jgi:hypothetical protein
VMRDRGFGLFGFCIPCGHFARIDLDALIRRFGPDCDTVDGDRAIRAVLRCGKCGRRELDLQVAGPKGVR